LDMGCSNTSKWYYNNLWWRWYYQDNKHSN